MKLYILRATFKKQDFLSVKVIQLLDSSFSIVAERAYSDEKTKEKTIEEVLNLVKEKVISVIPRNEKIDNYLVITE